MAKNIKLTCPKCGNDYWGEDWHTMCVDCYKAEQADIRKAEKEKLQAKEFARAQEWENSVKILPDLEGSDAQIAWATVIRRDIMYRAIGCHGIKPEFFGEQWEELTKQAGYGEDTLNAVAHIRDWVFSFSAQKSAKWWIDNRETEGLDALYILSNWGSVYNASLVQAAKDEKIAEIKSRKPHRPECLNKAFSEYPTESVSWNGCVYGKAKYKNLRFYVNNKEYPLSQEEATEMEAYIINYKNWKKELEEVQK